MANRRMNRGGGIKTAIAQVASGGVTRNELRNIARQTGASSQQIIKRMDAMNSAGRDVRLNSGAANMLIKQAQQAKPSPYGQPSFGTGNIGRALQGMIGTPGYTAPRNPQSGGSYGGSYAATPGTGMMIGGTQIRKGGRTAVRPMGTAPAVGDTTATTAAADGGTATTAGDGTMSGDQYDFQSMLDDLTAMQEPQFDMGALTDMFNTQFEQLSSQFDTMDPLQLAQLGITTNPNAIRARQRQRKQRADYRRGLSNMLASVTPALASMGIGGGVTL